MGIVLIETSWNVKTSQDIERMEEEKVLIETSWNVKHIIGSNTYQSL